MTPERRAETESTVLNGIFNHPHFFEQMKGSLTAPHFLDHSNNIVINAINEVASQGKIISASAKVTHQGGRISRPGAGQCQRPAKAFPFICRQVGRGEGRGGVQIGKVSGGPEGLPCRWDERPQGCKALWDAPQDREKNFKFFHPA